MKIFISSALCSEDVYCKLFKSDDYKTGQQYQKFYRLIAEGLYNNNQTVMVCCQPPLSKNSGKKVLFSHKTECIGGISFKYLLTINLPIIKNILTFTQSFFYSLFFFCKYRDSVLLCDPFNVSLSAGALFASKIVRTLSVGIITDIPTMYAGDVGKNIGLQRKLSQKISQMVDSYVLLTDAMNEIVNIQHKPNIVIEGFADISMLHVKNKLEDKYEKNICLYTGGIRKIYGMQQLVEGFIAAEIENAELWIYGGGSYKDELCNICSKYNNVKYMGVVDNAIIVKEQLKATLLINPRPTTEIYTKYSFPSKNMEYMTSGTPVLTTCLQGMPAEYYPYVFLLEDETVKGMAEKLQEIFEMNKKDLHSFGNTAKEWIIKNKNNTIQMKKLVEFINGLLEQHH